MIVKRKEGYVIMSESKGKTGRRRKLGGPYKTRAAAQKRLNEIEGFKHMRKD